MRSASPDTDPVLAEIVKRLVADFQPERIYLFGSRARGDAGPDSDYDLLMVLGQLPEPAYRLARRAHSSLVEVIALAAQTARAVRPMGGRGPGFGTHTMRAPASR